MLTDEEKQSLYTGCLWVAVVVLGLVSLGLWSRLAEVSP